MEQPQPPFSGPLTAHPFNVDINNLLNDPSLLKIYGNTFSASFSIVDFTLTIFHGVMPQCMISMSWQSAKLLQAQINTAVSQMEASFKPYVVSIEDIQRQAQLNDSKSENENSNS